MTKKKQVQARFPFPEITETLLRRKILKGIPIYDVFIQKAKQKAEKQKKLNPDVYLEIHHIVPKHASGSDAPGNLVQLLYNDHLIAHYLRWLMFGEPGDKTAYSVMSGQSQDIRLEIARLGGTLGGPKAQALFKEQSKGWFNSQGQARRGAKGAKTNKQNQTGAWDPENDQRLQRGRDTMNANPEKFLPQKIENFKKGRNTQKELGINLGSRTSQRLKSIKYWGVVLNGIRYSVDTEQRTYLCETTLDYYILYAP